MKQQYIFRYPLGSKCVFEVSSFENGQTKIYFKNIYER